MAKNATIVAGMFTLTEADVAAAAVGLETCFPPTTQRAGHFLRLAADDFYAPTQSNVAARDILRSLRLLSCPTDFLTGPHHDWVPRACIDLFMRLLSTYSISELNAAGDQLLGAWGR